MRKRRLSVACRLVWVLKTALIWIQRLETESCSFPRECWHVTYVMSRKYAKTDEQMILSGGCTLVIPACDRVQQVLIRAEIISLSSLLCFILNHNSQHRWELGCLALRIRKTNVHYHISRCVVDSVKVRSRSECQCVFLTVPTGGVLCFFFFVRIPNKACRTLNSEITAENQTKLALQWHSPNPVRAGNKQGEQLWLSPNALTASRGVNQWRAGTPVGVSCRGLRVSSESEI